MRLQAQGLCALFQKGKHSRSIFYFLCSSYKCKHSTADLSMFLSAQCFTHPGVPNETFAPGCSTPTRNCVIVVTQSWFTLQGLPCLFGWNMGCRELPPSCTAALAQAVQHSTAVIELLFTIQLLLLFNIRYCYCINQADSSGVSGNNTSCSEI